MEQRWQHDCENETERLHLGDFVQPDSHALDSVIIAAKKRMASITEERWGRAVAELPAYYPPSEWAIDPIHTLAKWVSWEVEAIYETLRERKISYAVERCDSTAVEQVIRTPEDLLSPGALGGPCLDLVLLMASCLVRVGLHPLVIIINNPPHAILGYWLAERRFNEEAHADEVPALFESRDEFDSYREALKIKMKNSRLDTGVEFIECTGLTQGEDMPFAKATRAGKERWQSQPIRFCLDVKTAWLTAPGRGIQEYLTAVRKQLGRLPQVWYPENVDFSQVRMSVRVRQGWRQYDETVERQRELHRRQGVTEAERQSAYTWRGDPDEWNASKEKAPPLDWDREVRTRLQRGVILGDPGFGKTWLLKYEGWRIAGESLEILQEFPLALDEIELPIYVRLAELASIPGSLDDALIILLKNSYGVATGLEEWIRERFNSDHCLLLLDGLDEVPLEETSREPEVGYRNELNDRLKHFADTHQCRIWLTSRTVGYQGPPFHVSGNRQQAELEILPFDRRQQVSFVHAWLGDQSEVGGRFLQELLGVPQIRGLAQVPLLLGMLCKTYETNQHQLPARRAELYETCLNGLLRGEGRESKASETYQQVKREFAEELAYQLFEGGMELFAFEKLHEIAWEILDTQPRLHADLGRKGARELIDELSEQDGLLVKAGAGENPPYLFLHLTFQEYLSACALARRTEPEQVTGEQVPKWLVLAKPHFFNPRWEEVIRLLASRIEDATPLIQAIWNEPEDIFLSRLALACKCLIEMPSPKVESTTIRAIQNTGEGQLLFEFPLSEPVINAGSLFGKAFPGIIPKLGGEDPMMLVMLGEIQHTDAIDRLMHLLPAHKDSLAGAALSRIRAPKAVDLLIDLLSDPVVNISLGAATALGQIGDPKAIGPLFKLLSDRDMDVLDKEAVAVALGTIANSEATKLLISCLSSPDDSVKQSAAKALGEIGEPKAIDLLITLLSDPTSGVRLEAAKALGEIGDAKAIDPLFKLLCDLYDEHDREAVAGVVGKIADAKAIELFMNYLSSSDMRVKESAADALSEIGDPRAVGTLISLLADMRVRKAATKALGKIGDPKAIAPLIGIIYEYINYMLYMLDLVRFITDKDVDTQAKHLWTFHAAIGAREAAEALGRIGAPEAADPLIDLLSVNQEMIDTVTTLDGIGSDQRKTLTTVLHEIQFQIARPTAKALGQIGAPKAVNLLIALLSCSGNLVRTEAADALGEIGDARAVNPLISLLPRHSYNIDVRWDAVAAAEALGKIGDSRAVGPLIDLISGRDDRWDDLVRCTAIRALGKIGDARAIDSLAQHLSDVSLCSPGMQAAQALRRVLGLGAIPLLVKHLFSKHFSSTNVVETLIDISRQQRLRIFLDGSYTKVS